MRIRKIPKGARIVRTYAEFHSYLRDFVEGRYRFLLIIGRSGTAKTESLRGAVRGHKHYYRKGCQLTPAQFYIDVFNNRGIPIILDDADPLWKTKIGEKLISSLGDTTPTKLVCYGTTSGVLGDVPQSFYTTSPMCIITNSTPNDEAILSRALIIYFDPTNLEIHRAVANWFWDKEIHDFIGQHLYRLPPLDSRWYLTIYQDKCSLRDWRQIFLKHHATDRASCIVQDLEQDPAYPTREDRARRFTELIGTEKGRSRASYFRLCEHLKAANQLVIEIVPPIQLRHTRPPGIPSQLELDSMTASMPARMEEETRPLDMPLRDQFAQPVRGQSAPQVAPQRPVLDDTTAMDRPVVTDEEEEGDE